MIALQPNWRYAPTSLKDTTLCAIGPLQLSPFVGTLPMEYEKARNRSEKEIYRGLQSSDPDTIQFALVNLAFSDLDTTYQWENILEFTRHSSPTVRQVAYTCLGHFARIQKNIEFKDFQEAVLIASKDTFANVRGAALDALDDALIFIPRLKTELDLLRSQWPNGA